MSSSIVRSLVTNKTKTVGLVVSEIIKLGVYHPCFWEQKFLCYCFFIKKNNIGIDVFELSL